MNELHYQKQIIEDVKKSFKNAYAIQMNNRFLAGIPDLLIKVPECDVLFVEMKVMKWHGSPTIPVETTKLQRVVMRNMERAGLRVAVWVVLEGENTSVIARTSWCSTSITIDPQLLVRRQPGKRWPILQMVTDATGIVKY